MIRDLWILIVESIAAVIAIAAALSFFSGQAGAGLVLLAGAWALVWWGRHASRRG